MIGQLPTRSGTYKIRLSALQGVAYTNFVPGRMESIRKGLAEGKKMPPIKLVVDAAGKVDIADGNHRLRVARERGESTIEAKFDVWRGKGTWAAKEEKRRGRTRG